MQRLSEAKSLFGDRNGEWIHKKLADKSYDERKQASMKIEEIMRTNGPRKLEPKLVINYLKNFINSDQVNHKKGGLIGTAAVAIALEKELHKYLDELVKNVLFLFMDEDARVRYYACEALYNISKAAGKDILAHFNEIFDGLCKLSADVDGEVKSAVQVLDRLMKDIVTQNIQSANIEDIVHLLGLRMSALNPYIRQLVLAWIKLLVSDTQGGAVVKVSQLPLNILPSLFKMLADNSRDIRQCADSCLTALLHNTARLPPDQALEVIGDTSEMVAKECFCEDKSARLSAQIWLHQFVKTLTQCMHKEGRGVPDKWLNLLPKILKGTLNCVKDPEDEIARMAVDTHAGLLEMVHHLKDQVRVKELVEALVVFMDDCEPTIPAGNGNAARDANGMVVRTACLQWVCMLLTLSPGEMLLAESRDMILKRILDTLKHPELEVVVAALKVLAQFMEGTPSQAGKRSSVVETEQVEESDAPTSPRPSAEQAGDELFALVTNKILDIYEEERQLLDTRGQLMIRQLCKYLDVRHLYVTVARHIRNKTANLLFAQQLVQTFNWILLTAAETKDLREELVKTGSLEGYVAGKQEVPLFLELLEPWFHNPVSALALCLWSQQYDLATELVARFATLEPTLDFLTQLDQLVHLLDSPVFSRLRLQLLDPRSHPALFKCLLGLSMLLPQARAFTILRERLHVMQSSLLLEAAAAPRSEGKAWWSGGQKEKGCKEENMAGLLELFDKKAAALGQLHR